MTDIYPFADQVNFTMVNNAIFDEIIPTIPVAEGLLLLVIIRKTRGWHKDSDAISYSQFRKLILIKSTATLKKTLSGLINRGLITVEKTDKSMSPFVYSLNKSYMITSENNIPTGISNSLEVDTGDVPNIETSLCQTLTPQKIRESKDIGKEIYPPSHDYSKILEVWKARFPNKPQPRANNKTVQGKLKARMKSQHFRENWEKALLVATRSDLLNRSSWFQLSWFLKNDDNYEKCLNGNYANQTWPGQQAAPVPIHKRDYESFGDATGRG